ncbi:hypothetical protein QBC46DRAFT_314019 [Diplogelasinospora grovesii]|uniref:TauD/TfdA-like domain-containing protein n=1 Tax=Diplogelasinospora grovesii TaxID=303347 RepID=A0AAN6S4M1_9PEZI|nr:hypothetical protein QBC46DRAFT_314019 [Diplogelasinospora grovesii]
MAAVCPFRSPASTAGHITTVKQAQEVVRPNIDWFPSYKVYKDRVERLAALYPNRPTTLPAGWPSQVNAERTWSGSDFASENDYIVHLSADDITEIEGALAHFKGLKGDLGPDDVNPRTFPLPSLGTRLTDLANVIHNGRGFVVLRGLNPDKYSNYDNILVYLGVTSYIAETRGLQDFDGRMLLHIQQVVADVKKHGSMPNSPYVARAQPFHTDLCDVLSLYALDVAAYGGESFLASSAKIYNEIARTRPDVIHVLAADDWPFDEFWEGQYHTRPLLYNFTSSSSSPPSGNTPNPDPVSTSNAGAGPGFQFSRRPLTGSHFSPHHPAVPSMSELQAEALDMVYFLAKEHAVEITLRKGDVQIFNNFAMLHARSSFGDDADHRRHMLRLWLRNDALRWTAAAAGSTALERISYEIYGNNEYRRNAIWDIDRSPPELRVKHRRASCA